MQKMGADLYIMKLPDETRRGGFEVSDEAVKSGYFRDCYNSYGLFGIMTHTLGESISWWQTADRKELFTEDEEHGLVMTPNGVKIWLKEVKELVSKFKKCKELKRGEYLGDKKWEEIPLKKNEYQEYFDWADKLVMFLEIASKLDSGIIWSV